MKPRVSVILPCYNVENYLDRCLNTIVGQTLKEIEIILVDDKSPDLTPQKCDEWAKKDPRIKVIHKTRNEGLGLARNTGLEQATGEYVAFVDSDDFVDQRMYESLYRKAKENDADAVYSNCVFYKDDNHSSTRHDVKHDTSFIGRTEVDNFLLDMVGPHPSYSRNVKYMMSVWRAVYKRQLLEDKKICFVSERELISEDLIFDIDYLQYCERIEYLKDAYYFYCDNGASLSRKIDKTRYERMKIWLDAVEARLQVLFTPEIYKLHYQRQQIHVLLYSLSQSLKIKNIGISFNDILKDSFWQELFNSYPFKQLPLKEYMLFMFLKSPVLRWIVKAYYKFYSV